MLGARFARTHTGEFLAILVCVLRTRFRVADAGRLWRLLSQQDAVLYVCGDGAHMAADVNRAIKEVRPVCWSFV